MSVSELQRINSLKVAELRDELKSLGLDFSGLKPVLLERRIKCAMEKAEKEQEGTSTVEIVEKIVEKKIEKEIVKEIVEVNVPDGKKVNEEDKMVVEKDTLEVSKKDSQVIVTEKDKDKMSKNEKRRLRKKEIKRELKSVAPLLESGEAESIKLNVEVEYVSAKVESLDPDLSTEFSRIFGKFASAEQLTQPKLNTEDAVQDPEEQKPFDVDAIIEADHGKQESNAVKKKKNRIDISELKQKVLHPEVVEMHDGNAVDPLVLCFLKGYRNTIPVPRHWSQKRRYLANRRGWVKPPFQLPNYIVDTGICDLRNNQLEIDSTLNSKTKQRARMQPKLHKLDIDYQVLHDAFFKYQTKPPLSFIGDVYHELKEMDYKLRMKRPGQLSDELKKALGLTSPLIPPPWLVNMQRYGPPPAYPNMKIPGLNAPIPPGARYGYGVNEWGKPPVDEVGRPVYGDPFGVFAEAEAIDLNNMDMTRWGELRLNEEDVSDVEVASEGESEVEDEVDEDTDTQVPNHDVSSGIESEIPSGHDTPDNIELRKKMGSETPVEAPIQMRKELYTARVGNSLFGSSHTYVLPGKDKDKESRPDFVKSQLATSSADGSVNIALAPEELENLDELSLKQKYIQQLESEKAARSAQKEDFSEIYEEENMKKKRKAEGQKGDKNKKFKF